MLIDDDEDFRALLRDELEALGHQVTCLEGADEGPETLAPVAYDLVILDNIMPRMTGIEFLKASAIAASRLPIILMTGNADSDTAIRAINLGAFDYVIKLGDIASLCQELALVIQRALAIRPPEGGSCPGP